jgi:hypothetical protein
MALSDTPDGRVIARLRAAMAAAPEPEPPRSECSFCRAPIVLLGGTWTDDADGTTACYDTSAPYVPHKPAKTEEN